MPQYWLGVPIGEASSQVKLIVQQQDYKPVLSCTGLESSPAFTAPQTSAESSRETILSCVEYPPETHFSVEQRWASVLGVRSV